MTEKNEALWLADWLDVRACGGDNWNAKMNAAAAELRRLHAQRDALLEKINGVLAAQRSEGGGCGGFINKPPTREHQRRVAQAWQELHEVIKAVEGEKA